MAITNPYEGSLTISTTELSLVSGTSTLQTNTTAGAWQALIDVNALVAGDAFRLRIYESVQASGTKRILQEVILRGAQVQPVYVSAPIVLMNGWDITLTRLLGADRIIPYSLRRVA